MGVFPTLINLHPNEYTQELCYYPFAVNLDVLEVVTLLMICLIEHVFQTQEHLNLNLFKMVTRINESKILTTQVSSRCKCKYR